MASPSTDRRLGLSGGVAFKAPVKLATTANITLYGEQSIDGVVTSATDVLVKNQTDSTLNGIYTSDSGAWSRRPDADGTYDLALGTMVFVSFGSTNGGQVYQQTTASPVIGTSAITWTLGLFSSSSSQSFIQSGTGAVSRSAQTKMRESMSIFDFGVVADGTTDDTANLRIAIAAAATAREILKFSGSVKITSTIVCHQDATFWEGDGIGLTAIINSTTNADAIQFVPTSITTSTTYINTCGIRGMTIYRATTATAGAGIRLTNCNQFTLQDVEVLDCPEGIVREGGQLIHYNDVRVFFSALTGSPLAGSSLLRFTSKQALDSSYSQGWTTFVDNYMLGGAKVCDANILIQSADGLVFGQGYNSNAYQDLVRIKPNVSGQNISAVDLGLMYLDGISKAAGTQNGINIADDGFSGGSIVNDIDTSKIVFCGNVQGNGINVAHPAPQRIYIDPNRFNNVTGTKVNITSTGSSGIIGPWLNWTPVPSFGTSGDVSFSPTTQLGRFQQTRDGSFFANWDIQGTIVFSSTLTTGNLILKGLPVSFGSTVISLEPSFGSLAAFNNVTAAGYTQFCPRIDVPASQIYFEKSGSGVSVGTVTVANITSSGTLILLGQIGPVQTAPGA